MNEVVENGIVSFVNRGNNRWYTWGDHTAAVTAGTVDDETYRFDSTVAVLYHILNRFILKWGAVIDSPMSLMLRDCILDEEQTYLNGLKAMGCLVGEPKCEFRAVDNSVDTLGKGQFYFSNIATVVPPAKYIELGIAYTDEGLSAYLEG
jgi:phage tail sheath protein FI